MSTPVDPPPGATEILPPQPPRSRYGQGTVAGIVLSMLVVGGVVFALIALVPRPSSVNRPAVDVAVNAREIARQSGLPVAQPVGLPAGWTPTSVRYVRSTGGILTWHIGYTTPDDGYVALEQAVDVTDEWVTAQTNRARENGTVDVEGTSWVAFDPATRDQRSILLRATTAGELTTLVTGKAPLTDLQLFAAALEPTTVTS